MAKPLLEALQRRFPTEVLQCHDFRGDETAIIRRDRIVEIFTWLRDCPDTDLNLLVDVTAVDYLAEGLSGSPSSVESESRRTSPNQHQPGKPWYQPPAPEPGATARFEVVYHLLSLARGWRLRVKVPLTEQDPLVDSLVPVYQSADWFEREAWDLYGIRFEGHPDLKRILLYEEFIGHPLRKDYPINRRQPLVPMKDPTA
ncbi:MAG: NADH-quinone oxidoreductase subunit C [Deltaproteobacteria bacterium]|nr:NADH-quinone oxidoreductase subunit C [Deltaproteobacteria bacterium]